MLRFSLKIWRVWCAQTQSHFSIFSTMQREMEKDGCAVSGRESGEGALSGTPQSALLSLGAAHTHFGHIQVSFVNIQTVSVRMSSILE